MNLKNLIKTVLTESPAPAPAPVKTPTPTREPDTTPAPFSPKEPRVPHNPPEPGREDNPEARSPWVVDKIVSFLKTHGIDVVPAKK